MLGKRIRRRIGAWLLNRQLRALDRLKTEGDPRTFHAVIPRLHAIFSEHAVTRPYWTHTVPAASPFTDTELVQHLGRPYAYLIRLFEWLHDLNWRTVRLDVCHRRNSRFVGDRLARWL